MKKEFNLPVGELKLRQLREICDSTSSISCEVECPIYFLCGIADNDVKKKLKEFIEVDKKTFYEALGIKEEEENAKNL